jgi:hypothetical protein
MLRILQPGPDFGAVVEVCMDHDGKIIACNIEWGLEWITSVIDLSPVETSW